MVPNANFSACPLLRGPCGTRSWTLTLQCLVVEPAQETEVAWSEGTLECWGAILDLLQRKHRVIGGSGLTISPNLEGPQLPYPVLLMVPTSSGQARCPSQSFPGPRLPALRNTSQVKSLLRGQENSCYLPTYSLIPALGPVPNLPEVSSSSEDPSGSLASIAPKDPAAAATSVCPSGSSALADPCSSAAFSTSLTLMLSSILSSASSPTPFCRGSMPSSPETLLVFGKPKAMASASSIFLARSWAGFPGPESRGQNTH